jgi:hypothetical protein
MVTQGAGVTVQDAKGFARAGQVVQGVGSTPLLKATRLRNSPLVTSGLGTLVRALPKARARPAVLIRVNELSQDDVTGAVLEAGIEGDLNLRQVMRLLLAYVAGDATGLDTNPVFKAQDGTTTRLAGTVSSGTRTVTTRDVT